MSNRSSVQVNTSSQIWHKVASLKKKLYNMCHKRHLSRRSWPRLCCLPRRFIADAHCAAVGDSLLPDAVHPRSGQSGTVPWWQCSWDQHGAHLGPTGARWAPCWPHEHCYLGISKTDTIHKSHNDLVPYPTIHHSEQTCAYFCAERCSVGYGMFALWYLCDQSTFSYVSLQILTTGTGVAM